MSFPYIPKELVNIILEFDGQIKYIKGEYVNIIHKHDTRYAILNPVINKKKYIIKKYLYLNHERGGFYFSVNFDIKDRDIGLCYDYNYSWWNEDVFEICYYDIKDGLVQQIRTFL